MASSNTSLSLASLDFDTLKTQLKTFLSTQSAFKDYDYEGSNMNVLLDVMSYNTFMNAFYINMAVSEMFLDSAQLRSSVVSHAKELNYTPRSRRSAEAVIDLMIPTSNAVTLTIPKGTSFIGGNINGNYTFTVDKTLILTSGNSTFTAANLHVYEGSYIQDAFVMNYADTTQKFILLDPNIDTNSLVVVVSENNGANVSQFLSTQNTYGINGNSEVYFLQTDIDGRYQILFGDGVLGRRPLNGSVITAEYRSCSGQLANDIDTFSLENDLGGINNTLIQGGLTITTVSRSASGASIENIESIRNNAPRSFQTQERVVTTKDYIDLILINFPDIESVNAYGGETISGVGDVEYGKVYVSCSTYSGTALTDIRKTDLSTFLKSRAILGITPVLVDPEYIYLTVSSNVHVDFNQTGLSPSQMESAVIQEITSFNDDNLKQFGRNFRLSALMTAIDSIDTSILSNETTIFMYKKYDDLSKISNNSFSVDFHGNTIKPGSVLTNQFTSSGKNYVFTDFISGVNNDAGRLFKIEKSSGIALNYIIAGSVDYTNGVVFVSPTVFDNTPVNGLKFFVSPANQDIYNTKNNILEIDTASGLLISIVSE
jgi:hypothetical protein